jgi:hypothetical protein
VVQPRALCTSLLVPGVFVSDDISLIYRRTGLVTDDTHSFQRPFSQLWLHVARLVWATAAVPRTLFNCLPYMMDVI